MPLIRVSMFPGRTSEQKAELVARLTDTFLDVCGTEGQSKDSVWVILEEVPRAHWGTGGTVGEQVDGPPEGPAGGDVANGRG